MRAGRTRTAVGRLQPAGVAAASEVLPGARELTRTGEAGVPSNVARERARFNFDGVAVSSRGMRGGARNGLVVGSAGSALERAAEQMAAEVMRVPSGVGDAGAAAGRSGGMPVMRAAEGSAAVAGGAAAPPVVAEVLRAVGEPLTAETRNYFEPRFGADLSRVRVHTDERAARSARAIGAKAYAHGSEVVFAEGMYSPRSEAGRALLAHELAHVMQGGGQVQRQPAGAGQGAARAPRKKYVFIMGADKGRGNPFYAEALRYFRAHEPTATFVTDQRSLAGVLAWLGSQVKEPIGDLYLVSHGNEDGTLAFGLDSGDKDGHLTVRELRGALHPAGGGTSALPGVGAVIDAATTIHIKGCDIGRTQEMVELIDEAFGGAGTVTAPTHEQDYSHDSKLGDEARKAAHDDQMRAFAAGLPPVPDQPARVDPKLKGDARREAQQEYAAAVTARKQAQTLRAQAMAAEEKRIEPGLQATAARAATVDSLSGPMFQREGTQLFTADEIQPTIDRLYGHLSVARRKKMASDLVKIDHGTGLDQKGQRQQRLTLYRFTYPKQNPPQDIPSEASMIAEARGYLNNPDRYAWSVETKEDRRGMVTMTVVAERVIAYLHHGSLDVDRRHRFGAPESNKDFYATSTFAPTAAAGAPGTGSTP